MVEHLQPGTEAETCFMAGRGMNGLRGVIVCFNPHNQRYTLELEKGDMMNLRARNVRRVKAEPDDGAEAEAEGDAEGAKKTADDNGVQIDSSLPNFQPPPPPEDQATGDREGPQVHSSSGATSPLGIISPINAVLAALVAYFYLQSRGGNGSQEAKHARPEYHGSGSAAGITWPVVITCAVYAYVAWEWGTKPRQCDARTEFRWSSLCLRLSFADVWEIMGLAGLLLWCLEVQIGHLVSAGVLIYFGWKFGTRGGNRSFSWGNVKASLGNLSIWEVWLLAGILESGLHSINAMARPRRR